MCRVGTCGLCKCAISEMPEAQKRGSCDAPGIWSRNSGANSPCTVEQWTPTFSKTRPFMTDITPPPPAAPEWSVLFQGVRRKRPGFWSPMGAVVGSASSSASKAEQISLRKCSNQPRACDLRASSVAGSGRGDVILSLYLRLAGLPQCFADHHRAGHRDIERAQAGAHRDREPRVP